MIPMTDSHLIERTLEGDDGAFEMLVIRYEQPVFRLLCALLPDAASVEDIAQETFVKVYQSLHRFDLQSENGFSPWLYTIARNLAFNWLKQHRTRGRNHFAYQEFLKLSKAPSDVDRDETTRRQLMCAAIGRLPKKHRSALVLSFIEELSHREIALIEGCSEGTVKSRIFRAKQKLAALLQADPEFVNSGGKHENNM